MLTSKIVRAAIAAVGMLTLAFAASAAEPVRPLRFETALTSAVVSEGRAYTVIESTRLAWTARISAVGHEIRRIAEFDPNYGFVRNNPPGEFRMAFPSDSDDLDGPHQLVIGSHGMHFDFDDGATRGFRFRCKAREAGVYLIYANWYLAGKANQKVESAPAVLTVTPATDPVRPLQFETTLSSAAVSPGGAFTVTETTRLAWARISSVEHRILRIGEFDPDHGFVRNESQDRFETVLPSNSGEMDGPPRVEIGSRGTIFDFDDGTTRGFRFRCTARKPGVYLIYATWVLDSGRRHIVESAPVVLTVTPADHPQKK